MILGLLVSLAVVVIFAIRVYHFIPRARTNEPIRGWMTLPYIARAYHIPEETLYQALDLPYVPYDHRPILRIARQEHRSVQSIITILEAAIKQAQPTQPNPPSYAPGPSRSQS